MSGRLDLIPSFPLGRGLGEKGGGGCSGLSNTITSYLKIGTPVATLLDAWRYRVCTGIGWPGASRGGGGGGGGSLFHWTLHSLSQMMCKNELFLQSLLGFQCAV